jgi:hypothetical protein
MRINEHNFAADLVDACRTSILRVAFTRGADLTLDIIAMHFDVAGHPRRELAFGSLTRIETQRFIAALSHDGPAWLESHDAAH